MVVGNMVKPMLFSVTLPHPLLTSLPTPAVMYTIIRLTPLHLEREGAVPCKFAMAAMSLLSSP